MMEANELNPNVSEERLTMSDDPEDRAEEEPGNSVPSETKPLKGLTMEVRRKE